MIKKLLLSAAIFTGLLTNAQTFTATYDFASTSSVTGSPDPTTPPTVTGITCGSFVAVGTPSANGTGFQRFSFAGWPSGSPGGPSTYSAMTGSISTAEYFEVTLTPVTGYTVTLNTIGFRVQRSGTGIKSYAVRSSADTYSANLNAVSSSTSIIIAGSNEFFIVPDGTSGLSGSLVDLTSSAFTFTSATSFRFYGWNSEAPTGTFSLDDVVFNGSVTNGASVCISPTITAISGNVVVCAGQSVSLIPTILGDTPLTYTWTGGSGVIGSANTASTTITSTTSNTYTLTVENACGTATAAITTTVNSLPIVAATTTSLEVCIGNTVTLSGTGALTYTWTSSVTNGVAFTPSATNDYTVVGKDINNCINTATIEIIVNNLPIVSLNLTPISVQCVNVNTVTLVGGSPTGGIYTGAGVTGGQFSPSSVGAGTYTITYSFTDVNTCSASASDNITVSTCTGLENLTTESFKIYPNPSNGTFAITSPVFPAKVVVYNVSGQQLISQTISSLETIINLSDVANGIYHLNISTEGGSFNYKMIINK